MLAKKFRISTKNFSKLAQGKIFNTKNFSFRVIFNTNKTQIAVIVSKKIARTSVNRNKIRRRVYSVISKNLSKFFKKTVLVIHAKNGAKSISFKETEDEIKGMLVNTGILN